MTEPSPQPDDELSAKPKKREPLFNVPAMVLLMSSVLIAIHVYKTYMLSGEALLEFLLQFAFIPARYGEQAELLPFGWAAWTSPVTYSFLHGDWLHLGMNLLWLIAFGTPVAKRFGPTRFAVLCIATSIGGALAHVMALGTGMVPMIGASAIVSGMMGAAARFAFSYPGSFGRPGVEFAPALSLVDSFRNRQFLVFFGFWFGLNILFGSGVVDLSGSGSTIAWQAHIGGFLVGVLGFALLDPVRRYLR